MGIYINRYLDIEVLDNGHITVNSSDGVFSSVVTRDSEEDFRKYCDDKAEMWLTSKLGNFDGWTKSNRMAIANKWLNAKALYAGKYPYYFNLGNIHDIFKDEVAELAKTLGINDYILTINE
jgi:hypothetical protein